MTSLEQAAHEVQRHYPRIYVACHVDHRDRRGQGPEITVRDQTILAHVPNGGVRPHVLATHLQVGAPTMSAALKRLAAMGFVTMIQEEKDARAKNVFLTDAGRSALSQTSVLDFSRVRSALARLDDAERAAVVRGLELLADAAQATHKRG